MEYWTFATTDPLNPWYVKGIQLQPTGKADWSIMAIASSYSAIVLTYQLFTGTNLTRDETWGVLHTSLVAGLLASIGSAKVDYYP